MIYVKPVGARKTVPYRTPGPAVLNRDSDRRRSVRYDLEFVSIPNVARVAAQRFGDAIAIVDGERQWSFQDIEAEMLSAVKAFVASGIGPGDRVGLCAPNSAEWIFAALGILGAGGVLVPVNTRFKGDEIAYVLRKSGASEFVAPGSFAGLDYIDMVVHATDLPALRHIVTLTGDPVTGSIAWDSFLAGGRNISDAEAHARIDAVRSDDLSDIMFTSGTTGQPKGVMLKHGASLRAYGWLGEVFTLRPGDTFLIIPPFFHSFGYKAGWLVSLIHGVKIIPQRIFDAQDVLQKIDKEHVSVLVGPPTVFTDLINHPRRAEFDLSSLRVSVPSAASVPVVLIERLRKVLGFDIVLNAYGLTEASALVSSCYPDDDPEDVATSVGRPALDVEVKIVDDSGKAVSAGVAGEILVRGYNVMVGYWEDPEATALAVDSEGWLHTGDIGSFNERGFLRITDRKKDMFIVGGFNAYPAEIENLLTRFGPIAHAAVIGMPDERLGEVGIAFVVLKPGASVTPDEVIAWSREHMANFKVPRRVEIVADLPRNASMKVTKNVLRQQLSQLTGQ
jgi:acyl-CoA synthetase (AMP-forming)/AMP-acid ligase II